MTVKAHSDHITQIKYINDIDKLVTTSLDSNICLIDLVTKEHVYYIGHAKSVHCVCFVSTHKYMASSGQERDIEIWNPYTQKRTTALTGHSACVKSIVFNPTHAHLITMSIDKNIIIWNPKTYERLCSVLDIEHEYRPENTFTCMEWNNRSKTLILAHSRLQIWPYRGDANEGLGLVLHKNRILAGLHNPSFANIVTIDESGLVIVWKLDSGEQITVWSIKHFAEEKITAAAFDKSDRRLMIGTSKGRVWLYNWNSGVRLNDLESDMDSEVSCVLNTISSAKKMDAARGHTVASGWNKHVSTSQSIAAPIDQSTIPTLFLT
jgi:WD40 repeat protein